MGGGKGSVEAVNVRFDFERLNEMIHHRFDSLEALFDLAARAKLLEFA